MKKFSTRSFYVQKQYNHPDDYEDAFQIDEKHLIYSIADGATESSFSKEWANILSANAVDNFKDLLSKEWINICISDFNKIVDSLELPWHAENKIRSQGSFATLAVLKIDEITEIFDAIAIGDSCIIRRDAEGIHLFPYTDSEEFLNRPWLVSTQPQLFPESQMNFKQFTGTLSEGEVSFYLMTDALANWFFNEYYANREPWVELEMLSNDDEFDVLIDKLRYEKVLKNDDVTLIILKCEDAIDVVSIDESV